MHSGTDNLEGLCQPQSSLRLQVAARFLTDVRVRCRQACDDSFIAVTELELDLTDSGSGSLINQKS